MSTSTLNVIAAAMVWVLFEVAVAKTRTPEQDHAQRQSTDNPPVVVAPSLEAETALSSEDIRKQIKAMEEMHKKMQAAQTPAERMKLMESHRKLMQKNMAMMEQMMKMMIDRELSRCRRAAEPQPAGDQPHGYS